jgi:hypothetical protein
MSVSDAWLIPFLVSWNAQVVVFFRVGLWEWGVLWLVIELTVVGTELWSKLASGLTLTQKLRRRFADQRVLGYSLLAVMGLTWGFLLLHLGWP